MAKRQHSNEHQHSSFLKRKDSSQTRREKRLTLIRERQKTKKKKKWLKRLGVAAVVAAALFVLVAGSLFAYFAKDLPSPDKIIQGNTSQTTKIYDRTGETVLYEIHGDQNRTVVPLSDIPQNMRNATIAIEDKDFYKHHGFDAIGIFRAVFRDVTTGSLSQGGSTITQQLVKNAILTNEKTFTRKIKEIILAIEIEQKFSKDQILQLYLNEIPYGSSAYGVESASRTFFNKPAKDLTLAEASYLASIPQAPTHYSPFGSYTDDLKARHETVLDRMAEQGFISKEDAEKAKQEEVKFTLSKDHILAPHFVFYVRQQLEDTYTPKEIEQGGLKVITTLDLGKQKIAEEEINSHISLINKYGASNAAMVSLNPQNGEVLAMVGSIDYFNKDIQGNVNVATRPQMVGSSFKPYAYALAFSKGYTPQTKVFDLNTDFGNGYKPKNYSLDQNGPIQLQSALMRSLNTPAVKVGYLVGDDKVGEFARSLGLDDLPKDSSQYGLATPLGVFNVALVKHTEGYGVFANQGKYNKPTGILKVMDNEGNVLEEHKAENKQVMDANVANTMSAILSNNSLRAPTFGTRNHLTLSDRPVAAKTGTTNDFKDALTMGYTPSLATGVWVGNNDGHEMHRGADGSVVAAPIWQNYMQRALAGSPVEQFAKANPIAAPTPVLQGKLESTTTVTIDTATGKLWTPNCPAANKKDVTYGTVHDILHFVDKNNPSGPAPKNPKADPQYDNWEKPVQGWAAGKGYSGGTPPTETCEGAYSKNISVSITSPASGQTVSGSITVKANASATKGVAKVEFFIDGALMASDTSSPYQTTYDASSLSAGSHTVTVRATDTTGATGNDSATIKIAAPATPPSAPTVNSVTSPTTNDTQTITGTKPANTALYINGTDVTGVTAGTSWSYVAPLSVGINTFTFFVKNGDGLSSGTVTAKITRI